MTIDWYLVCISLINALPFADVQAGWVSVWNKTIVRALVDSDRWLVTPARWLFILIVQDGWSVLRIREELYSSRCHVEALRIRSGSKFFKKLLEFHILPHNVGNCSFVNFRLDLCILALLAFEVQNVLLIALVAYLLCQNVVVFLPNRALSACFSVTTHYAQMAAERALGCCLNRPRKLVKSLLVHFIASV